MPKFKCDKCKNEFQGKFCPECGDKRTKKDEEMKTDKEMLKEVFDDCKESIKSIDFPNKISIIFYVLAALYLMTGMYYKVQEDLVKAVYFVGYMVVAVGFLIAGILVQKKDKK